MQKLILIISILFYILEAHAQENSKQKITDGAYITGGVSIYYSFNPEIKEKFIYKAFLAPTLSLQIGNEFCALVEISEFKNPVWFDFDSLSYSQFHVAFGAANYVHKAHQKNTSILRLIFFTGITLSA